MDSIPDCAQNVLYPEVMADLQRSNRYFHVIDLNKRTENQYPLLGHFFTYNTTAVKT